MTGPSGPARPEPALEFGLPVLDVEPERWVEAVRAARDEQGMTFFDWLSAVDDLEAGLHVVVHLYDPSAHRHLLVRTRLAAPEPSLPTLTGLFAGAGWHERETHEMFGVQFRGHPDPRPLLLPPGAPATPLRKQVTLAERERIPRPGEVTP